MIQFRLILQRFINARFGTEPVAGVFFFLRVGLVAAPAIAETRKYMARRPPTSLGEKAADGSHGLRL